MSINNDDYELVNENLGVQVDHHYDNIERNYIQMSLGGVYRRKSNSEEYQLMEYLEDINQAVFKNLSNLRNEVLSVHDFGNITDKNDVSIQVDLNDISDKDWQ